MSKLPAWIYYVWTQPLGWLICMYRLWAMICNEACQFVSENVRLLISQRQPHADRLDVIWAMRCCRYHIPQRQVALDTGDSSIFLSMSSEIIHIVFGSFRRMNGVFLLLGAGFLCFLINYHGGLGCFLLPLIMRINASGDNTLVFNLPRFVLALDWKPLTQFRIQVDSWYLIYVNYLIPQHLIPPNLCLTLHGTFTWIRRLFACGPEAFTLHTHLRPSE